MSEDRAVVAATDHAATLSAWRERGAHHLDPVRFGFIEGLVRRAAAQTGTARQLLDEKIAGLMASYEAALAHWPAVAGPAPVPAVELAPKPVPVPSPAPARVSTLASKTAPTRPAALRGPLGTLAELIERRRLPASGAAPAGPAPSASPSPASIGELKALDEVRSTWARLDAEQRLEQALAHVPANAGPLNSYHLVLRTLTLMRDVSPEYLQRFMAHVDALMWLESTAPSWPGAR